MLFSRDLSSPKSMISTYASVMGYVAIIKPMIYTVIPQPVQNFVVSYLKSVVGSRSSTLTLTIQKVSPNGIHEKLYYVAQAYLSTKISPNSARLNIARDPTEKKVNLNPTDGEVVFDVYNGIELKWMFFVKNTNTMVDKTEEGFDGNLDREYFELSFDKKHRDLVLNSYIPYVESKATVINSKSRILKMYSNMGISWRSVNFNHPSTFDTLAMNKDLKRAVMEDLDRFVKRKDLYKRVGKAWKRGYLLYGPPGTGKTSLVAAIAHYLKFDIYDLQLASVQGDAALRRLLLGTQNRSILLVEDIDCSVDLPTRLQPITKTSNATMMFSSMGTKALTTNATNVSTPLTFSGLLNCIDGLWSSCGNERIIIFTSNNKEKLDPALLRPGRMDMHIYMGHCGFEGFKTLASNYLGLSSHENDDDSHRLYPEIKHLIDGQVLTPAQIAEELMKNEDADVALEDLVRVLKRKRSDSEKCDDETKKKMKTLEEGDKSISNIEETEELIDSQVAPLCTSRSRDRSEFSEI